MRGAEVTSTQHASRRPVAPRVADRDQLRTLKPPEPIVLISPEDSPLRGWRRVPAVPLVDAAWRRGIETNAVACYFAGRRRGGIGESVMAFLPFLVLIGAFAWLMMSVPLSGLGIWTLTLLLAVVLQPMALIMGALLMGWGLRRYLTGLSAEQLLVTRLKPEDILRGLAIRPICRIQAIAIICSLCVPALAVAAVVRADLPFTWEWIALGWLGFLVALSGTVMASQLGASLAMRAHIYLRDTMTAIVRTFIDMFGLALRLSLLVLVVAWLCGMLIFLAMIIGGNSPAGFVGLNRMGGSGVLDLILLLAIGAVAGGFVLVASVYVFWRVLVSVLQTIETAVEFTYLYPEEWWLTNPGRGSDEDTYRLNVPWISPHNEMMEAFRSRACGK